MWGSSAGRLALAVLVVACKLTSTAPEEPFVTFVIPSRGSRSLETTLGSLLAQDDGAWKAIVAFDGLEPELDGKRPLPFNFVVDARFLRDPRIKWRNFQRARRTNCLAHARSAALDFVLTPWVAFVDEQHTVSAGYVRVLRQEASNGAPDVVVFRSRESGTVVAPALNATDLLVREVDWNFAYRPGPERRGIQGGSDCAFDTLRQLCYSHGRCVLSGFTAYFRHGMADIAGAERPAPLRTVLPTSPRHLQPEEAWELRQRRTQCSLVDQGAGASIAPFVLAEDHDKFFRHNVASLRRSLARALGQGCLPEHVKEPIHIVFKHNAPPGSHRFIQVQLEQHKSNYFGVELLARLRGALQIWEMTPDTADRLADLLPDKRGAIFSVPTYLYEDPDAPQVRCPAQPGRVAKYRGGYQQYREGCYTPWTVDRGRHTSGTPEPSACAPPPGGQCPRNATARPPGAPEVLVYAALQCSHENNREKLCDQLHEAGFDAQCFQNLSGALLEEYICAAKVVVVDNAYQEATLSTHRIDALLHAGKVVVAVESSVPTSNAAYEDFVVLTKRENVVRTVREVLDNFANSQDHAFTRLLQFREIARNVDALCYALRSL